MPFGGTKHSLRKVSKKAEIGVCRMWWTQIVLRLRETWLIERESIGSIPNWKSRRSVTAFGMAIPQYRPTSFGFTTHGATHLVVGSSSSRSSSNSSSDTIDEIFYRVPFTPNAQQPLHRVCRNLSPTSSQTSNDGQRNRRLHSHCSKCHQMRMNRWSHDQRYSIPFMPIAVANERRHGSSIKRRSRRRNRW